MLHLGGEPPPLKRFPIGYNGATVEAQHFLRFKRPLEAVYRSGWIRQYLGFAMICHSGDELFSRLIDDRERAVMAWQHRFEIEVTLAGESCNRAAHREAVADGNDPDLWLVKLVDKSHVGENVRVTHVIKRRRIFKVEYQTI